MEKSCQMNFRCNAEVKAEAERVFSYWGLSLADALNAFMVKAIEVEGMPFELRRDVYSPIKFSDDDPRVKKPARNSEGAMVWDDEDPDEEGAIYERFATR